MRSKSSGEIPVQGGTPGVFPAHRPSTVVAPSLLAARFTELAKDVRRADGSGAEWLHLDIMDGHFVPNISFGPELVRQLRPLTNLFFDVHLMCSNPEILFEPFFKAGANSITIHAELGERVPALLFKLKSLGLGIGLALNPGTPLAAAEPFLKRIDLLLIMTVNPGFGGQPFIAESLPKIQQAVKVRQKEGLRFRIEVDGGINERTARDCASAGADTFVSGTSVFAKPNLRAAVSRIRKSAAEGAAVAGKFGDSMIHTTPGLA